MWAVACVLGTLVLWILINPVARWRYRNIPGPVGWPIIGHLGDFAHKGIPIMCQELVQAYGPICKFWFGGGNPWVVIHDPDIARKLSLRFITRYEFATMNVMPHRDMVNENKGLFHTEDLPFWRTARKAYDASLLQPLSLAQYTPTMDKCVTRLTRKLNSVATTGQIIDMWQELGDMTLEVVGECAYGIDFHSVDDGRDCNAKQQNEAKNLVKALRLVFEQLSLEKASGYLSIQLMFPLMSPMWRILANMFPDKGQKTAYMAHHLIRNVSQSLVADWTAAHDISPSNGHDVGGKKTSPSDVGAAEARPVSQISDRSFLNSLLAVRGKGKAAAAAVALAAARGEARPLDDKEVVEQTVTFMQAGYETTASTLAFCIYLLAVNPVAESRLLQEVDTFGRAHDISSLCDLDKFPYADAVVKEALRMHSPAPFTTRKATEDLYVLGKLIPRGATLVFPSHSIHNDVQYWPRPAEFLPERFLPDGKDTLGPTTANAHLPFGLGARMCPGYKFAQNEAKIALVRLYQNFTFALAPGMPRSPRTYTGFTTRPADGVLVTVYSRK